MFNTNTLKIKRSLQQNFRQIAENCSEMFGNFAEAGARQSAVALGGLGQEEEFS